MLKQLMGLLLSKFYSKQENAIIGQQAFPSTTAQPTVLIENQTVTTWSSVGDFVAPTDGYIFLSWKILEGYTTTVASVTNAKYESAVGTSTGTYNKFIYPIKKGTYFIVWAAQAKELTVKFLNTAGGGLVSFFKLSAGGCHA